MTEPTTPPVHAESPAPVTGAAPAPLPSADAESGTAVPVTAPAVAGAPGPAAGAGALVASHGRWIVGGAIALAVVAGAAVTLAWNAQQRVKSLETELVRRQQDSSSQATEARTLARQAEQTAREAGARTALLEARLAETTLQRGQLEDLIQSLARSRDESVLSDIDGGLRLALQQAAITGSVEPLVIALQQAEDRLARANQPRLERVRRAVAQDLERARAAGATDVGLLALRLDEVIRQVDDLPLVATPERALGASARAGRMSPESGEGSAPEAVAAQTGTAQAGPSPLAARGAAAASAAAASAAASSASAAAASDGGWARLGAWRQQWSAAGQQVWQSVRDLVRVTRIAQPEAMLVAPAQAYFLRENLKLRLLNARLALLSRQFDTVQSDLGAADQALDRYFDTEARRVIAATELLRQVSAQAQRFSLPRPDATLAAIAALAPGAGLGR